MAYILGAKGGHTTLTGTSGNDTIIAQGGYNTILGGGGNDFVEAGMGGFADVMFGAPGDSMSGASDTVALFGTSNLLTTGDENITATGQIKYSTLRLGNGANFVDVRGAGNTVHGGIGSNTIIALGGNAQVYIQGQADAFGPDQIFISGIDNVVENTISYGPYAAYGTINISGGSGNGNFSVGRGGSGNITTAGTNNTISGSNGTIVAGSGFDSVSSYGVTGNIELAGLGNTVNLSAIDGTVSGGSGDGSFYLTDQYYGFPQAGAPAPSNARPYGNTPSGMITFHTGGLDNSATLFAGNFQVDPGSGADTVQVIVSSAAITFHGSHDQLVLNGGQDTVTVNDQSAGLDVVLGQFGETGALTLDHFDRTGIIDFGAQGGGFTSVQQIVNHLHETSAGTYTLATLDHTGTITFDGVGALTASNFKL